MGTVGDAVDNAVDNAVAEGFFASLQCELLDRHNWPTRAGLAQAMFHYVEAFYNPTRSTPPSATSAQSTTKPHTRHDHTTPTPSVIRGNTRVFIEDLRIDHNWNRPHTAQGDLTASEFATKWTTTNQPQAA